MKYEVEGIITAATPIFHGGDEKTGSTPMLRTIFISTDAGEVPIPYISGNAIRGKLRRLLISDLLFSIGYDLTNTKLYHSLFSGGVLESTEETIGYIDLALRKRVQSTLIPISLLGCAIGNQLIQGKLIVEHMFPLCAEYRPFLPQKFQDDPATQKPIRVYTDQSFITRRDELRAERTEEEQAVQMKVDYECFAPGTKFYHRFILVLPNELEISCLGRMIELFELFPFIGGRSSSGDGKVIISYSPRPDPTPYLTFVSEAKDSIRALLSELENLL